MSGTLYLVPTPIGNLGDISRRMAETLEAVDFIAAEDTRVSLKLLNHLGIKKPMVSYHEHNKAEAGPRLVARLQSGESCALVTDAGTPAISDPGEDLVRLCAQAGVPVCPIPGPSAVITALSAAALPTGRFCFEGFLPQEKRERTRRLGSLTRETRTMVFYEAPHRRRQTLEELLAAFGPDRPISLCRELTKLHEEMDRTTLGQAAARYGREDPRGEFVLVVAGCPALREETTLEEALALVRELTARGMTRKDALKQAAKDTGFPKNQLYDAVMREELP